MALDFHKQEDNEYLFGLESQEYIVLSEIFKEFNKENRLAIPEFDDVKLSITHQKHFVKLIDQYINKMNLDIDKQKSITIIEFRGLLTFFINKEIHLQLWAD